MYLCCTYIYYRYLYHFSLLKDSHYFFNNQQKFSSIAWGWLVFSASLAVGKWCGVLFFSIGIQGIVERAEWFFGYCVFYSVCSVHPENSDADN